MVKLVAKGLSTVAALLPAHRTATSATQTTLLSALYIFGRLHGTTLEWPKFSFIGQESVRCSASFLALHHEATLCWCFPRSSAGLEFSSGSIASCRTHQLYVSQTTRAKKNANFSVVQAVNNHGVPESGGGTGRARGRRGGNLTRIDLVDRKQRWRQRNRARTPKSTENSRKRGRGRVFSPVRLEDLGFRREGLDSKAAGHFSPSLPPRQATDDNQP